ncbi:MAG: sensor histidine kinase [Campylobacterales bacterium]
MSPLRIALIYLALSVLWILLSDRALLLLNPENMVFWQNIKGIGFVGFTAVLLFYLINRLVKKLEKINTELEERVEYEVAKRREGEQILINQARLNALSETLRLVAHHWRQPLTRVALMAQDIEDSYLHGDLSEEQVKTTVGKMMSEMQAMSHTIDQFSYFFSKRDEQQQIAIYQSVDRACKIVRELMEYEKITVVIDSRLEGGDAVVNGSPSTFKQALLTILTNAREAIERSVKEGVLEPGSGRIEIRLEQHEGSIAVMICNNGEPISSEHAKMLFSPYFTTKFAGSGVGLSLYAAKTAIEKQMGGRLSFENRPQGVCFTIRLNGN